MFVQRVKEKEAELKEAEKEVNVTMAREERLTEHGRRGLSLDRQNYQKGEGLVSFGQDLSAVWTDRESDDICVFLTFIS